MRARSAVFGAVALFFVLAAPSHLTAATVQFQIYLDSDNNPGTGCNTTFGADVISGADRLLTTTVDVNGAVANVTGVTRQDCSGGAFGAPITVDSTGWPVGTEGASGNSQIETHIPLSAFGGSLPTVQRLYFVATAGSFHSVLRAAPNGSAIMYPDNPGRRHAANPGNGPFARNIVLDGQVGDWNGITPVVTGGASNGITAVTIQSAAAFASTTDLYFRIDAKLNLTAPIATDDTYQGRQGKALSIPSPGVLLNDVSPTSAALTALLVNGPSHGTVSLTPAGGFTYVNDGASAPVDQFTYKANDGTADSNTATVTVNISPDGSPIAHNDAYNVPHGGTLTVPAPGVLFNDDDPDSDQLTASVENGPQHGNLTLNSDGSFTYTHNGSNSNTDSFTYRASDGVLFSSAFVSITIGPDAPPVANSDTYTVAEGGTLNATTVFANDTDADSPQALWTATTTSTPAHGTLTFNNSTGTFTYVHDGSETITDSFTYVLSDGIVSSAPALVTITITPVNDLPVANADAYSTNEDTPLTAPSVLANDTDADIPPQTLTAVLVTGPAHGTLTLNPNGTFTYTPTPDYNGTDSFTYNANDGVANSATPATVTITISAVNDPPVFTAGANVTVNEDSGAYSQPWATGVGAGGGADENGQTLTFNITGNTNAALFSAGPSISSTGVLSFTPAANANGVATITVNLSDNGGGTNTSAPATFTITVNSVNDAPTFNALTNPAAVNEDAGAQTVVGFASGMSAGPANESTQTLTFNVSNNNNALFSAQPSIDPITGNLIYTPAADAFGSALVTVTLQDDGGTANGGVDTSTQQTFTITVNPVNDAPSFTSGGNVTGTEDTPFSQAWATAISVGPANESAQTVTFNVTNNSNPSLFAAGPAISPAGLLTFTPAPNANGVATITVNVQDNGGTANGGVDTSAPQTFTITVNAINDAPSFNAVSDPPASNEDAGAQTVLNFATGMSAGPADEAGQTLTFNVTNNSNAALFSVQPAIDATTGTLTYTAAADAFGTATITINLQDNGGTLNGGVDTSAPQTFTITVNSVNDAPTFTGGGNVTGLEDTPFSQPWATAISAGPPNESSQTLTFNVTNNSNPGLFAIAPAISPAGVLTFTPAPDANGSAIITVDLQDNGGGTDTSAPVTFTISVTAVNDAPSFIVPTNAPASDEDAGPQTVPGFATAIAAGPVDEAAQTLTFNVTGNSNPGLFSVAPSIDAAGNLTYTATPNIGGTADITVVLQDNGGTANGGVDTSAPQTFTITVNAVNDPPSFTAPASITTNEDVSVSMTGGNAIIVSDPDAGSGSVSINLEGNGVFFTIDLTGVSGCCSGGPSLTISGTVAQINAALATLVVTPSVNYNGPGAINIIVNDNGNTGSGGAKTASGAIPVTINAVNDPPINTINPTGATNEDTPLNLSNVNNGVNVADVDAGSADIDVQFTATNGTLSISTSAGLTTFTGNNTASLHLVGPQSAINSDLLNTNGGLVFTPAPDFNGTATVTMVSNDLGNTGAGGPLTDTDSMTITVNAVNDAPVNTLPASPVFPQDTTFTFTGAGNVFQVSDVDAGANIIGVTLTTGSGTITLGSTTSLQNLTGNGTAVVDFRGTLTDINNALNGLQFTPTAGFFGTAQLRIISDDFGFTGAGGPQSDDDTLLLTVQQSDQPPVNTVPGTQTVNEDTPLAFTSGNAISIADPDSTNPKVTLTVTNGTLTLGGTVGLAFTTGDGTADATMTFSGSISAINTALNGLTYLGNSNFNGTDTLTITTDDQETVLPNGPLTDSDTVTINVTAVNDAPVAFNDNYTGAKNTTLTINNLNGVLTNDSDIDSVALTAALVSGPAHASSFTLNLDGSFSYTPNTGFSGIDSFTYKANDGSLDSNIATVTITIPNAVPTAVAKSFTGIGNTSLEVGSTTLTTPRVQFAGSLLAGNSDPDPGDVISTVAETVAGSAGGSATIASDGSFVYSPLVNVTSETFTYHVTDGNAVTAGTVTITLNNKVWYVNNQAPAGGTGTSVLPFSTLVAAQTASATTDVIYVEFGDGTTTGQNAGIALKANQQLIGSGVALVVSDGTTNRTLAAAGSKPQLTNTTANANVVDLANGNTVKGLVLTGATGFGSGLDGNGVNGLTADSLTLSNNHWAGVDLEVMTGTVTITNSTFTGNASGGLSAVVVNFGSAAVNVDNTNTIDVPSGGGAISVGNHATGAVNIGAEITGNGTITIVNNPSGTISFGGAPPFDGKTITLNADAQNAISISGNAASTTINFADAMTITNTTGAAFMASGAGTLSITGAVTANGTGAITNIINIDGSGGLLFAGGSVSFASISNSGFGATNAILLKNLNGATAGSNGTVIVNGGTMTNGQTAVSLSGSNTSITLSAVTINGTYLTGISNLTNFGTVTLTNSTIQGGTAVNLANGTLKASGSALGSSINTGQALLLNTVVIGAGGATFTSTNANGGTFGVSLTAVTGQAVSLGTGQLLHASGSANFLVSGGTAQISYAGDIFTNTTSYLVDINNHTTGSVTLSGNLGLSAVPTSTAGSGIRVQNSSGTLTFSGTETLGVSAGRMTNFGVQIVNSGGATFNFSGTLSIFTGSATGFTADSGTINFSNNANVINSSQAGLILSNVTLGAATFSSISSAAGTNGISLTSCTGGTVSVTGGSLSGATGATFLVSGGNVSLTYGGTISQGSAQPVVSISGGHSGTLTFGGNVTGSANGADVVLDNADGTYNFNATNALTNGAAVNISNGSSGTMTFSANTSITSGLAGANSACFTVNSSNPVVTYAGTLTQNAVGKVVDIDTTSGGSVSFTNAGGVNGNASSTGVRINNADGNVTFTAINLGSSGSRLSSNGVTISNGAGQKNLGALNIFTTGSGEGVHATSSTGQITATGSIDSNGAAAFNIVGTSAANRTPLNVQLTKVNATGGANGIVLQSTSATGTPGGFNILGSSSGTCGGVAATSTAPVTSDCTGGQVQSTTGATGANSGIGILLTDVDKVSLTRVRVNGHSNFGLKGTGVSRFTLASSYFHNNGDDVTGDGEGCIYFYELTGATGDNSITNSYLELGAARNLHVLNTKGTLDRLTVTGTTIGNDGNLGADGIFLQADNSANVGVPVTLKATVQNGRFLGSRGDGIQLSVRGTSVTDLVFTGNNMTNNHPNQVVGSMGVTISSGGTSSASFNPTCTYTISNNTINNNSANNASGPAISVGKGGVSANASFTGTISNNFIGTSGVGNSGSAQGSAIVVDIVGGGTHTSTITNNTIRQFTNYGVLAQAGNKTAGGGTGKLVLDIRGNSIAEPSPASASALFPTSGIRIVPGTNSGDDHTVCATVGGLTAGDKNSLNGTGTNGGAELRIFQRFVTVLAVPGYGGANNDNVAMNTFLIARNNVSNATTDGTGSVNATNNTSAVPPGPGYSSICP